jgi:hypothetical protein
MKKALTTLFAMAAATPAILFATGTTSADAAASSVCPTYNGCIHSNSSYNSAVTWNRSAYATYAIYGWNGNHYVENSQTKGAFMQLLDKNKNVKYILQDGRTGAPPRGMNVDMGPIYYIRLVAGPSCWPRCV